MNVRRDPETGLNKYEESYIKERAAGKDPKAAYLASDYSNTNYPAQKAQEIEKREKVQAAIKALKAQTAARDQLTRDDILTALINIAADDQTGTANKIKALKQISDICGFINNQSTLSISGSMDIKSVRENAINDLLQECKSTKKP